MIRFLAGRLAVAIPTLLLVSVLVFGLQKLLPGDPALALAGEERSPEVIAYLRAKYQFDQPIPVQYFSWLTLIPARRLWNVDTDTPSDRHDDRREASGHHRAVGPVDAHRTGDRNTGRCACGDIPRIDGRLHRRAWSGSPGCRSRVSGSAS